MKNIYFFSYKRSFRVFSVFRGLESLFFKRSFRVFCVFRGFTVELVSSISMLGFLFFSIGFQPFFNFLVRHLPFARPAATDSIDEG